MSVAELKLELIRAIDQMTEAQLKSVQHLIGDMQMQMPIPQPQRRLGALKGGLIYMAPDFDAPLEDFKAYME